MYNGKRILAVIPARAGSKRFPDKNLAKINGLTLVEHAVNIALDVSVIDKIAVTSDEAHVLFLAKKYGDVVVIERPETLSKGEHGSSHRTWKHAWDYAEDWTGDRYDYSVLLEPTSPNRTADDVRKCIATLSHIPHPTVVTVTMAEKLFQVSHDNKGATQMSRGAFMMNGVCYAAKRDAIFRDTDLFSDCYFIDLARRVINIDYPEDLDLARFFFRD